MTPTRIMYDLAGSPPNPKCCDEPVESCAFCALPWPRSTRFKLFAGSNFTGQNTFADTTSDRVCEPCVWIHAWSLPPGMAPSGDGKKGTNLRYFSHLWSESEGYLALRKDAKPKIADWLMTERSGKWFAVVSDSGKRHLVPFARVSEGPIGVVRFEGAEVRISPGCWDLHRDALALVMDGVPKGQIATGLYSPSVLSPRMHEIRMFESKWSARRGGGLFGLSLWLATKGEKDERGKQDGGGGGPDTGAAPPVSLRGRERPQKLGPSARRHENGVVDGDDAAGVRLGGGEGSEAAKPVQASLFGDD